MDRHRDREDPPGEAQMVLPRRGRQPPRELPTPRPTLPRLHPRHRLGQGWSPRFSSRP